MNGIPEDVLEQIREALRRPEGTFEFTYQSTDLFDAAKGCGILLEVTSGQHLFRFERDEYLILCFYHSSPGTGTRVASVNLAQVAKADSLLIALTWHPDKIGLHVGPRVPNGKLVTAVGQASSKEFRVGKDGSVYQVGDEGVEVMGISLVQDGKHVLQSTPIQAWKETIRGIQVLGTGNSEEGYLYEVVVTNLTLAILVTGFETYLKRRLEEIEQEGIAPQTERLIESFFGKKDRESGITAILEQEAEDLNATVLQRIIGRRVINFQSYSDSKKAYNRGYNLKFGEIGVPNDRLEALQKYIRYRHRIIHVSPLIGMLNQDRVPSEEPVFAKEALAKAATACFDGFVNTLHAATLQLRPDEP